MKPSKMKKILIPIIVLLISATGLFTASEYDIFAPATTEQTTSKSKTPSNISDEKSTQENNNTQPENTNPQRTSWTEWDEEKYPDFYREVGPAVIDVELHESEIQYYGFDDLGRTQTVVSHLNYSNYEYGKRDRESISHIYPSGWYTNEKVTLHFANGKTYNGYFYNRSHLLAHSLGGSDEKENMITGTRTQNVGQNNMQGGIQYCEMLAYNYLKNNPNGSVYYIVTPIYNNNELVPRSIIIDMKSNDNTINKEIEIFNVSPGYTIDYTTGQFTQE